MDAETMQMITKLVTLQEETQVQVGRLIGACENLLKQVAELQIKVAKIEAKQPFRFR